MSISAIFLGIALFLLISALIARPLLDQSQYASTPDIKLQSLLTERDNIFTLILDLEDDFATQKIAQDFFTQQRQALVLRGADILQQLDTHADASVGGLDDEIEAQIATFRSAIQNG